MAAVFDPIPKGIRLGCRGKRRCGNRAAFYCRRPTGRLAKSVLWGHTVYTTEVKESVVCVDCVEWINKREAEAGRGVS